MMHYVDQAPFLYFSTTDDGTLVEVNDRLCSMLQYNRQELLYNKVDILFTISTRIFQQTHFFPLLKMQGHAEEIFITMLRKDGEHVPVLINAERKTVGDTEVNVHAGIIVHNRKKFEEELIAARKEAERALKENTVLSEARKQLQLHAEELDRQILITKNHNSELQQFSRVVTHDMQEPLRKLSLFSGLFTEVNSEREQEKVVEKIRKALNEVKQIMSGLQQYVWLNDANLNIENLSVNAVVTAAARKVQEEFKGVALDIKIEDGCELHGDSQQFDLLFFHLLSNAVRFRKGETADVCISFHKVQKNQYRQMEEHYKYVDHIMITITDKGIGFDPVYKSKLFGLFRRLHPGSGRGTGLAICKKIIDYHRGTILIDSKVNVGTTVTIYLPIPASSVESQRNSSLHRPGINDNND